MEMWLLERYGDCGAIEVPQVLFLRFGEVLTPIWRRADWGLPPGAFCRQGGCFPGGFVFVFEVEVLIFKAGVYFAKVPGAILQPV